MNVYAGLCDITENLIHWSCPLNVNEPTIPNVSLRLCFAQAKRRKAENDFPQGKLFGML